jgi:NAD(P)-dependent dehydrogenase (short-subunit alcohol dehydrogenase family)
MLTKSLARELGPEGIRVNAIAPGGILTRAVYSHVGETSEAEQKSQLKELKNFMRRMALGRMGEADEIARAVLYSRFGYETLYTGEVIAVDGGYLVS